MMGVHSSMRADLANDGGPKQAADRGLILMEVTQRLAESTHLWNHAPTGDNFDAMREAFKAWQGISGIEFPAELVVHRATRGGYMARVCAMAAALYGVPVNRVTGPQRGLVMVAHARQLGYYLLRFGLNKTLSQIADAFGREHSSVLHGIREVEKRLAADPAFQSQVAQILGCVRHGVGAAPIRGAAARGSGSRAVRAACEGPSGDDGVTGASALQA